MQLRGSCHCGAVRFKLKSAHPYPYNRCYCSICRKTAGGGGYSINIAGDHDSLDVEGEEDVTVYRARIEDEASGTTKQSTALRHFCRVCGSALWVWDPRWPELVHPFASAIDSPLPVPPERTHLMLGSRAPWVEVEARDSDKQFENYPDESIEAWHKRLGLEDSAA